MFETKMTVSEANAILEKYQKRKTKNELSYVPHIMFTGSCYPRGQVNSGHIAWNFTHVEAEAWLVIQTKRYEQAPVSSGEVNFKAKITEHKFDEKEQ
jgi:hypothetical protein